MQRRPSLTESKLMIMRSLAAMEPLDENQLAEFFGEMELMNFFEVKMALSELAEAGLIAPVRGELAPEAYLLTASGRETYAMFAKSVPLPLRDRIDALLPEWRRRFRRREHVRTRAFRNGESDFCAQLEVYEHGALSMELKLHFTDLEQAQQAARSFERAAEGIYRDVWSAL